MTREFKEFWVDDKKIMTFKENIMKKHKLLKNKIYALILISLGILAALINNEITILFPILLIGVILFKSNKNWIV